MAKLLLATRSADKVREIREILSGVAVEVVSLADAHVGWRSAEEDLEEHDSFLANARTKAEYFSRLTGLPTVADDSGLEVLALGGQPGVRSHRFAPDAGRLSAWRSSPATGPTNLSSSTPTTSPRPANIASCPRTVCG